MQNAGEVKQSDVDCSWTSGGRVWYREGLPVLPDVNGSHASCFACSAGGAVVRLVLPMIK